MRVTRCYDEYVLWDWLQKMVNGYKILVIIIVDFINLINNLSYLSFKCPVNNDLFK